MTTEDLIASDLRALADSTARDLSSTESTARALDAALTKRSSAQGAPMFKHRRPLLALAGGLAAAAAVLVVPVPYAHRVGWDVTLRSHDGRAATVHLGAISAGEAQKRATKLGSDGATVTVAPRTEMKWGSVYAMAAEKFFHIDVNMDGKSDDEIEAEIRAQLDQQGWSASDVQVTRSADGASVSLKADDGAGGHMEIRRDSKGGDDHVVQIQMPAIDDTREPGMTDEQLRDKIVAQFKARGLDAVVTVSGNEIRVRAEKEESR